MLTIVASRGLLLKDAILDREEQDVKGAALHAVYRDVPFPVTTDGSLVLSSVTGHRSLLKYAVLDHKKRDVEGTATRVVDQDVRFSVIL